MMTFERGPCICVAHKCVPVGHHNTPEPTLLLVRVCIN